MLKVLEKETEWNDSLSYLKKEFKMECSKREDVEKEHEREVVKMQLEVSHIINTVTFLNQMHKKSYLFI